MAAATRGSPSRQGSIRAQNGGHDLWSESWSPDGRLILYWDVTLGDRDKVYVAVMRPDGSHRRFLWPLAQPFIDETTWSPDGRQILSLDGTSHLVARDIGDGHVTFRAKPTLDAFVSARSWQPLPIRSR